MATPDGAGTASASRSVLVTGACGHLGRALVQALAALRAAGTLEAVVGVDVREPAERPDGVEQVVGDVRDAGLALLLRTHRVDAVVHLASIVSPGRRSDRAFEHSVDVGGTRRVIDACLDAGVRHLVVSSSGAAYGYHADNPPWLTEDDPVRGHEAFAYAHHKRLVEELLAQARAEHPALRQTVFRIGTILGATMRSPITDLFDKPRLIGIRGADSPFVFVWDQDVVGAIVHALRSGRDGIYNLAGDGVLTLPQIAERLGKPVVALPPGPLRAALALLKRLGLTQYGPEQIDFLRYRPVLDNRRLKTVFGYVPRMTSSQAFDVYRRSREAAR